MRGSLRRKRDLDTSGSSAGARAQQESNRDRLLVTQMPWRCLQDIQVQDRFRAREVFTQIDFRGGLLTGLLRHERNSINIEIMTDEQRAIRMKGLRDNRDVILSEYFLASDHGIQGAKAGIIKGDD